MLQGSSEVLLTQRLRCFHAEAVPDCYSISRCFLANDSFDGGLRCCMFARGSDLKRPPVRS